MINAEEILQSLIECGKLDSAEISNIEMNKKRKEIIEKHKECHSIWEWRGKWFTCVKDAAGKKATRKRNSLEELADFLIDYYEQGESRVYLRDVFEAWINDKLRYGDILKQSYDRYTSDFYRYFQSNCNLCQIPIGDISAAMLEEHVRETIRRLGLSRKAYSGMITVIRGTFKRARKMGLTELIISQVLEDMEIPRKAFTEKQKSAESEVFMEDEIPRIVKHLQENPDEWNLALLLQFQTGMRVGEIVALRWRDIEGDVIHVRGTEIKYKDESGKWVLAVQDHAKTAAGYRDIVVPPQTLDVIKAVRKLNPFGEYVFMHKGKRMRGAAVNRHLGLVCDKVGISKRSSHKIRKTYGTTLLDAKVDDALVAAQMGHKDVATTRKLYYYCNSSEDNKRRQVSDAIYF